MGLTTIISNEPAVFEIAHRFETLTEDFPWGGSITHTADAVENLWRYYNIVFAVASHRLLRASIAVMEAGLVMETLLPLRTHLELLGIQRYLEDDKQRVVTFAARGSKRQQQLVERARKLGHGKANDWSALASKASKDLNQLRTYTVDIPFTDKAEEMLRSSAFNDDVDGILRVADNWVHMNAAALSFYAHAESDGKVVINIEPDEEGAAMLLNAVRYHYGIVAVVNEVLSLGQDARLDALWKDFQSRYGPQRADGA